MSALYEIIGLDILMHEEGEKLDYIPLISHKIAKFRGESKRKALKSVEENQRGTLLKSP